MLVQDNNFWAWLAGFIDGEGYFGLFKHKHPHPRKGYMWTIVLDIVSKDRWILEFIAEKTGMGMIQKSGSCFSLKLYSNMLRAILPKLVTYLVLKRRQAELLQKALGHMEYRKHRDDRTDEILENLSIQLKSLR